MFSPITATCPARASFTVLVVSNFHVSARNASISAASVSRACSATCATYAWNFSFLATKSVSAFTSTATAFLESSATFSITIPSAAILLAFFCAVARPFSLRNSIALSISPSVAVRAFLQSIIPAPLISLNSFTIAAVIAIMISS